MDIKKGMVYGMLAACCAVTIFCGHVHVFEKRYEATTIKADVDGIDGTTKKEWAAVYQKLGKHFDAMSSKPMRDLSSSDLKRYLEMD